MATFHALEDECGPSSWRCLKTARIRGAQTGRPIPKQASLPSRSRVTSLSPLGRALPPPHAAVPTSKLAVAPASMAGSSAGIICICMCMCMDMKCAARQISRIVGGGGREKEGGGPLSRRDGLEKPFFGSENILYRSLPCGTQLLRQKDMYMQMYMYTCGVCCILYTCMVF